MGKLRVLDLFSGIGGFSLGLERTGGFKTVAFCEIEDFPRRILKKHWPEVPIYEDVRTLKADEVDADVITAGFPCQDISVAGRKSGIDAARSGLWSEVVRLVGEIRPAFLIVENVANLLAGPSAFPGRWAGRVFGDLAELGYDAEWENIPASALGAPHNRERVWIIAYPYSKRSSGCRDIRSFFEAPSRSVQRPNVQVGQAHINGIRGDIWDAGTATIFRISNGIPGRLDALAALGSAVVPQIPELIGNAILAANADRPDCNSGGGAARNLSISGPHTVSSSLHESEDGHG